MGFDNYLNSSSIGFVKFVRGTEAAWEKVTAPDKDTLYFIINKDGKTGRLYLGSKLICDGDPGLENFTIEQITDVLLDENLRGNSLLAYDEVEKKWVNKTVAELFSSIEHGFEISEPTPGELNYYLRADGTWSDPNEEIQKQLSELIGEDEGKTIREIVQENCDGTIYWGNF